jgi:penicillin-binding protein 1A
MGSWGQGARSALPMVGEVFQQAFRNRWLDRQVEFDIPRPRPAPPPEPLLPDNPVTDILNNAMDSLLQLLRN